jgi:hypothetical protein
MESVTNKKEVFLAAKPYLFTIKTITLPKLEIFNVAILNILQLYLNNLVIFFTFFELSTFLLKSNHPL